MDTDGTPRCKRCAGPTTFAGRISLPAQMIYSCTRCDHQEWVAASPPYYARAIEQPQAQQQQQPQKPDDDKNK